MAVQAIIMAGGEGTRLRPLTCDVPKPLVPVLDKPVMEYALQLLRRHGITEIGATLFYLPERITQHFGDGADWGVSMRYWQEQKPVGTAGSVLMAKDDLDETFVVLSGDGLTDCDLSRALDFHRQSGAVATLVMKRVPVPLEYGVVITEGGGRVRRFVEKPGWGEVFSDTVNTGIYILQREVLDMVPAGQSYDFGRDLFPLLVAQKKPVFGWVMDGYWCDIGNQEAYVQAQVDFLQGRVALDAAMQPDEEGRYIAPDAQIAPDAVVAGPCWIGSGARILSGAVIGAHAVIGEKAEVGVGASVKQSVLWRGAEVGQRAQVRGAVIGRGARAGDEARLFEGSVLGDGSALGARTHLSPGVKVWPGKQVDDGLRLHGNLVWGDVQRWSVDGSGVTARTPEQAAMLGAAWAHTVKAREVALMRGGGAIAQAQYAAVSAGLMAQGVRVTLIGEGTVPMLRSMQRQLALPAGIFVHGTRLEITGRLGSAPTRDAQRGLETLAIRQDFPCAFEGAAMTPRLVQDAQAFYIGALAARADSQAITAYPPRIAIFVHNGIQRMQAEALVEALHLHKVRVEQDEAVHVAAWETGFLLAADGESAVVFDSEGMPDEAQQAMLRYQALLTGGASEIVAPVHAPRTLEQVAAETQAKVLRVKSAREAMMQALLDAPSARQPERLWQMDVQFDGLAAIVALISLLARRSTTLRGLLVAQPKVQRATREVACALADNGRILRALAEEAENADLTDGLRVEHDRGWALLLPVPAQGVLRVLGEAQDAEFAKELCDRYVQRIEQIAREKM